MAAPQKAVCQFGSSRLASLTYAPEAGHAFRSGCIAALVLLNAAAATEGGSEVDQLV